MPARTNPFQKVIATVYKHLSDDTAESKMLRDRRAETDREVDLVVIKNVAGEEITIGVEATAVSRKVTLTTVDSLLKKHEDIGTHHLVIVSKSGFTEPAMRKLEESKKASGYQPKDLAAGEAGLETRIVGQLASLWQKRFSVTLTTVFAEIELPRKLRRKNLVPWVNPPPGFDLLDKNGDEITTPEELFVNWADRNIPELGELLDVAETGTDANKTFLHDLFPPWTLDGKDLGDLHVLVNLSPEGAPLDLRLFKVVKLDLRGPATIGVTRFDLQHQRLNESLAYSVGEAEIDGQPTLLVASAAPDGEKLSTLTLGSTAPTRPKKRRTSSRRRKR